MHAGCAASRAPSLAAPGRARRGVAGPAFAPGPLRRGGPARVTRITNRLSHRTGGSAMAVRGCVAAGAADVGGRTRHGAAGIMPAAPCHSQKCGRYGTVTVIEPVSELPVALLAVTDAVFGMFAGWQFVSEIAAGRTKSLIAAVKLSDERLFR